MPRPALVFEPFEPSGLAGWLVDVRASYIRSRIAAGDSQDEAETNTDRSLDRLLPDGSPAPGQRLGRVLSAD